MSGVLPPAPLPPTPVERVERRYYSATKALDAWRVAQHAAVDAEYQVRIDAILSSRQRDFQAAGLDEGGTHPA